MTMMVWMFDGEIAKTPAKVEIKVSPTAEDVAKDEVFKEFLQRATNDPNRPNLRKTLVEAYGMARREQQRRLQTKEVFRSLEEIFADLFKDSNQHEGIGKRESELITAHLDTSERLEQAEALGDIDGLTGVLNRKAIERILGNWLHTKREEDIKREFALVFVDIDHFKNINDTYGHNVGDEVLKVFGELLRKFFRKDEDEIGRWGGEEFVILLPAKEINVQAKLEQLWAMLQKPLLIHPQFGPITVTASIGWTIRKSGQQIDPDTLVNQADKATYQAKDSGRNQVLEFIYIETDEAASTQDRGPKVMENQTATEKLRGWIAWTKTFLREKLRK